MDKTPKEYYEELRQLLVTIFSPEDVEQIDKAFKIADRAHEGQLRCSGQPYVIHPILVAKIVAELGMDKESVIAALLHDVVEDTDLTLEDVTEKFGKSVASLVDGVTKLGKVPLSTREEVQAENV